ncbi:isoleucine--tRNA ligase [Youngiibacter fragilis]|uniref:Isoleucine--tRNA ligase n=1 Tax=Youngiibacter fragilis 232.1 TaxID=994573 RepID=V7I6H5_9CLOT|nr:isoleucine--tRNA ligase [Youngiibacter fragilis]ETA80809.1 isoleucyl-tRNA synthase [Youngiibacter fragilis 232.1]
MYKKVDGSKTFTGMEKEVRELWKEKDIINRSYALNPDGESFTFYDGPPTANGKPHVGHVLTRVVKDLIPRYKSMKGYQVLRKAGWDTHGLPVELEVEKKLGISGKQDIEAFGVENFIKECKESVFKYVGMWKEMSDMVGFWVDMDNPYVTFDNNYIESEWWALKTMWENDLLYKGFKVMPYCPRCGTGLSSHEVAQGYKDVRDTTAIAKFRLKGEENKYILAWTTTPWTLPSNAALALNKNFTYAEVKVGEEILILAKELIGTVLKDLEHEVVREFLGEELLGKDYEQLIPFHTPEKRAFFVIHGDFVTLSDGTGIVHIAPAYGEDDYNVGMRNNIPFIHLVDAEGKFVDEVTPFAGMNVKKADSEILHWLEHENKLFSKDKYLHSYPHCWRCDTPLLYYPKDSWFVKMSSLRDELMENSDSVNWYPDNIRTGRMGKFLENVIDWSLSRDRYWGTPLPIWECSCGHRECIGGISELKEKGIDVPENIELHKPYIDEVFLKCEKCGGTMKRTHEVIDAWFDSGSMPFAQWHYPFENKEIFEKNFPAQFISEAVDQTRGWFYTLLAISTALFGKSSFQNCIVLGHVLDKKGIKMSKHKGNVVEPMKILEEIGADATRWHFLTASAPWLPVRFSEEDVAESQRKFISTYYNVYSFYVLYAELDNFNPLEYREFQSENIMDKWILSKLNSLVKGVEEHMDSYDITGAALLIEDFTDELSNWYVRRNRARFWSDRLTEDKIGAYTTLYEVLVTLTKVAAPFIPFLTEEVYQNLVKGLDQGSPESVHLTSFPSCIEACVDKELEKQMDLAYSLVKLGRSARNAANIKNRQPLSSMLISEKELPEYYGDIIKDELNVKEVVLGADLSKYVNYEIKPNLPVLGKAFGKLIPGIKAEIGKMDQMTLARRVDRGETVLINVSGTEIGLSSENLLVTMQGLEGFAFSGEGELGVVLDTNITEELREEGNVREVISKIQTMRKEKGFEVADKIILFVSGNDLIEGIIRKNSEHIMKETLTLDIRFGEEEGSQEANINGEKLMMGAKVAAK